MCPTSRTSTRELPRNCGIQSDPPHEGAPDVTAPARKRTTARTPCRTSDHRKFAARPRCDHDPPRRPRRGSHQSRVTLAGDYVREMTWPIVEGTSLLHLHINRGKQSLTLNLKHPDGVAVYLDLVRDADVVIEAMRPGSLARLGLGYRRTLASINPKIVFCNISGIRHDGSLTRTCHHTASRSTPGLGWSTRRSTSKGHSLHSRTRLGRYARGPAVRSTRRVGSGIARTSHRPRITARDRPIGRCRVHGLVSK